MINDVVEKNIDSLASGFDVFAPATVNTVPIKLPMRAAIRSHLRITEGEAFAVMFIDGTNRYRHATITNTALASDSTEPVIKTPSLADILEYG